MRSADSRRASVHLGTSRAERGAARSSVDRRRMPVDPAPDRRPLHVRVALVAFVAVAVGLSLFTFRYAKGLSYLSTDPLACVNCHIMQAQYDGWQHGSHHAVANCVDCHLPADFVPKYLAKAENGYRHGRAFTTQDFAEPIVVAPRGREILQNNCLRCHDALAHGLGEWAASPPLPCTHCHAAVGHGDRAGLGGPLPAGGPSQDAHLLPPPSHPPGALDD